eukprot:scaffold30.g4420.t1
MAPTRLLQAPARVRPANAGRRALVCAAKIESPFKHGREMDGLQAALAGLPTAGVYAAGAALAAALGGAGWAGAHALAPEGLRAASRVAAAAAGAALGGLVALKLKERRSSAAMIELANLLVAAIEAKYGTRLAVSSADELKAIYGTFVEAVVPPDRAIEVVKRRSRVRDNSGAVAELKAAVEFNRGLAALANDPEVVAGVGPTSVLGGSWGEVEGRAKDLRELFRRARVVYLEERLEADGAFTDALEGEAADLRTLMGLGAREAAGVEEEVKEKTYRRLLREEFTSGRLDAAPSKADVLSELVDKVGGWLHRWFAGIDAFSTEDRRRVQQRFNDLRMDRAVAREVIDDAARKAFLQYISKSRNQRNRLDASKELKRLVFFSNIVVAPLVEDLKTEEEKKKEAEEAEQQRQIMEMMQKAREEAAKQEAAEKEAAERGEAAPAAEAPAPAAEAGAAPAAEQQQEAGAAAQPAEAPAAAEAAAAEAKPEEAAQGEQIKSLEKAQLPADLGLEAAKARKVVEEQARDRKRTQLVQAVSYLRQRKLGEAAKSLNNVVSCEAAVPGGGTKWEQAEEVADLYSGYVTQQEGDEAKREAVQRVLGLSDSEAAALRDVVAAGGFKVAQQAEEEAAFF